MTDTIYLIYTTLFVLTWLYFLSNRNWSGGSSEYEPVEISEAQYSN